MPTAAGLVLVTFLLIHLTPGDPVVALGGEHGDAGYYALVRARFGLDRPLPEQLLIYASNVGRGDLGVSFVSGQPVIAVIAERIPATLVLIVTALGLSTITSVALGIVAARRADRPADVVIRSAVLLGHSAPAFWLGQIALLALAVGAGFFPVQGMTDPRREWTGVRLLADVLHHLALPAFVLAAGEVALITRLIRTGLLAEQERDYVRTARAKGLPERAVLRHALGNTLLPVVTVIGARVGMLCSGAVIVETVFAWPGLGRLLLTSVLARDYPVILGIFLLISFVVVLANLVTDLLYGWLDPRVAF